MRAKSFNVLNRADLKSLIGSNCDEECNSQICFEIARIFKSFPASFTFARAFSRNSLDSMFPVPFDIKDNSSLTVFTLTVFASTKLLFGS